MFNTIIFNFIKRSTWAISQKDFIKKIVATTEKIR